MKFLTLSSLQMMFLCFPVLTILLACTTHAIQIKPSYGPPPQREPHREYGVPQQMPFREYGPPALKYGPPNLNFIGGGSSSGLHEEIKNHYGAPKPFYGPPYKPPQQFGPPSQIHNLPLKPASTYGPPAPPQKLQHKPANSYGPPKLQFGPPPPQALPLIQSPPQFKPIHQPASSYGPPPSGPLNIPQKQVYGPPPPNYGPPPLPNLGHRPETTLIITGGGHSSSQSHKKQQQTQIQVDASGHTHSVVGSQAPFHSACDGWKPIPAPAGAYIENNHIDTQSGYSQVAQAQTHSASTFSTIRHGGGIGATVLGGNSILDGLTDEQLVAVALQSSNFDVDNTIQQKDVLPSTGPARDFNHHGSNSKVPAALQLVDTVGNSYSKPPADSYAPGSKPLHSFHHRSNTLSSQSSFALSGPVGNFKQPPHGRYGPPPRLPSGNYGPPPPPLSNGNYGPPPPPPSNANFGPPPLPPKGNYQPPPPAPAPLPLPQGNYGPPPLSAHVPAAFSHHHSQAGLGIQYGKQTGNLVPFPPLGATQPSKPVAYRPPVPQGLFETIGATVQHFDKFGVKPQLQAPTYIPPAANEIPHTGPSNLNIDLGAPPHEIPQNFLEQQLPQQKPAQVFVEIEQNSNQLEQHQQSIYGIPPLPSSIQQELSESQYLPPPPAAQGPPPLPQPQYLPPPPAAQGPPPQPQYLPPPPAVQLPQQYLPPTGPQQQPYNADSSFSLSGSAVLDSSAFATNQHSNEFAYAQQEQPRYPECGHGPNLVGGGGFNYQQQQQQQQYRQQQQYSSASSSTSITHSIPIAEQHSEFVVAGPDSSYGSPSLGINEIDHVGYASENAQVSVLPDGTNPDGLPGLKGLNVLSAEKSEPIHISSKETKNGNAYRVQFDRFGHETVNHEEILSADLLQTILNAVEQPQAQHQPLPANHKAENRSDIEINEDETAAEDDQNESNSGSQEYKTVDNESDSNLENLVETPADVHEIKPIVVKEENAARH